MTAGARSGNGKKTEKDKTRKKDRRADKTGDKRVRLRECVDRDDMEEGEDMGVRI